MTRVSRVMSRVVLHQVRPYLEIQYYSCKFSTMYSTAVPLRCISIYVLNNLVLWSEYPGTVDYIYSYIRILSTKFSNPWSKFRSSTHDWLMVMPWMPSMATCMAMSHVGRASLSSDSISAYYCSFVFPHKCQFNMISLWSRCKTVGMEAWMEVTINSIHRMELPTV